MMQKVLLLVFSLFSSLTAVILLSPRNIKAIYEPIEPWSQELIGLPYPIANHSSVNFLDRLYAITGSALTYSSHDEAIYPTIDTLGNVLVWNYDTKYPKPMIWTTATSTASHLYVLGGYEEYSSLSHFSDDLVYSTANTSPISWIAMTSLPQRLSMGAAVTANNYIYFSGGWTDTANTANSSNKVYFAPLNIDGSVGSWIAATDLPNVLWGHAMFEINGYLFIVGGFNSSSLQSSVYRSKINPNGTIGSWETMPSLPSPVRNFASTKVGNYIFIVGGASVSSFLNTVFYTSIDNDGLMENWQTSNNYLITVNCCGALAETGGYLYLTGGVAGSGNYTNKVYRTKLNISLPTPTPTPIPLPTSSPTPTPTPTPSPTPTPLYNLDVEDIKQYAEPWASQIYDHATRWTSSPTIKRWGCALTSAAMILKYYGHSYANPDTLNSWLNLQPDGYIRDGLVNWLAVSRYSKEYSSGSVPILKFVRLDPNDTNLENELQEGRPAIIKVTNHFVVAKNKIDASFGINDPAYSDRTSLDDYLNTYFAINSFRPTQTDLSYILLVLDGDKNIKVFDPAGNEITGYSFIEEPLVDDVGGTEESGKSLTIFQYPTPLDGKYKVEVTGSSGTYSLDSYLYKIDGSVTVNSYQGLIKEGQIDTFLLSAGDVSQSTVPVITIDSLIDDLDNAYSLGLITKKSIYKSLRQELLVVKKLLQKKNKNKHVIKLLVHIIKIKIIRNTPRYIKQPASDILINNIEVLISSL